MLPTERAQAHRRAQEVLRLQLLENRGGVLHASTSHIMQNPAPAIETPQGQTYLAVVREVTGFRFYLNSSNELTKYPMNALKFDSPDAATAAICAAGLQTPASGVALLNANRSAMNDEPMVWKTQR